MTAHSIIDDDGNPHTVRIYRASDNKYYAREQYLDEDFHCSEHCATPELAIADMTVIINSNCAKTFFTEVDENMQSRILTFCKEHFTRGIRGNSRIYNSYHLKHVVQYGVVDYVSNGQLKGAMLHLGYPIHKTSRLTDINYTFCLKKLKGIA